MLFNLVYNMLRYAKLLRTRSLVAFLQISDPAFTPSSKFQKYIATSCFSCSNLFKACVLGKHTHRIIVIERDPSAQPIPVSVCMHTDGPMQSFVNAFRNPEFRSCSPEAHLRSEIACVHVCFCNNSVCCWRRVLHQKRIAARLW